jgi:hypothetical protein
MSAFHFQGYIYGYSAPSRKLISFLCNHLRMEVAGVEPAS